MPVKRLTMVALVFVSLLTAACGGGGVNYPVAPSPVASATATAASGTGISSSGVAVAATGVSGIMSSVTIAGTGSVAAQELATAPSGLTAISSAARKVDGSLKTQATTANTPLVYIQITATSASTITGIPALSATFASAPAAPVYLAYYSGSSWVTLTGPATISGAMVTFAAGTFSSAIALAAKASLNLAIYTGGVLSATAAPSASPTATATASSPATSSGTPFPTGTAGPVSITTNFFTTILPMATSIKISAWDISTDLVTALVSAAHNGANVTIITPFSEHSGNDAELVQIGQAGGHVVYEYSSATPAPVPSALSSGGVTPTYQVANFDIHAKFAVINGTDVYMDGHNWFTTDVIFHDTNASDITAVKTVLNTFPSAPPNGDASTVFTTDKQVSLQKEGDFLQSVAIPALTSGAADDYDFITESYNSNPATGNYNDNVAIGFCQIASIASHPKMRMVFEEESGYSTATKTAINNLFLLDPVGTTSFIRTNNNGHEKISMIRKNNTPLAAWFGSSNATTTDLYDWGMVTRDPIVLTALASYFDNVEFANSTAVSSTTGTVTACGSVHS